MTSSRRRIGLRRLRAYGGFSIITCGGCNYVHLCLSDFYSLLIPGMKFGWYFCMDDGYLVVVHTSSFNLSASRCNNHSII